MNDSGVLVSIRCFAYNQEQYIRQCLDGFIMQKTNFRFEAIVHDDASTDGTATIIKEYAAKYPDIIIPIFETENQYSKHDGSIRRIMNSYMHGKFIAYCEGDDYWIDPYKLQKQVDFLESHPDYGLVRTNVNFYYQDENLFSNDYFSQTDCPQGNNIDTHRDYIMYGWFAAPCTWMFRASYLMELESYSQSGFFTGDLLTLLVISAKSKIKYFGEATAVYRVLNNSASHFVDEKKQRDFWLSVFKLRLHFAEKQNITFRYKFFIKHIKPICSAFHVKRYPRNIYPALKCIACSLFKLLF